MRLLVKILLRQALINNPSNPLQWLEDLQTTKWTSVSAQNGQIIGSSVNGKSVTLQMIPGTNITDIVQATEVAMQFIEAGGDPSRGPGTTSIGILRITGFSGAN